MTSAAPTDGGSNSEGLKEKLKHPFQNMREKFRDSSLYDVKVGLIHKKYAPTSPHAISNSTSHIMTVDFV